MLKVEIITANPFSQNTALLYHTETKSACIIDPGAYSPSERTSLVETINQLGLKPKYLLNTHCHLDHVFSNRLIAETFGLELYIHPLEEQVLRTVPVVAERYGIPMTEELLLHSHFLDVSKPIDLDGMKIEMLFCPGHSPGSVCFYNLESNICIGGDVLFRDSIGRTDLPGGDYQTLISSIKNNLFKLPKDMVVYPGHGPSTTIGYEKKHNSFLK